MAWGYEKCFVIEHDNTLKRRIDCKDCCYYNSEDKSCMKRPLYLPVDGYNSWRTCNYFELDSSTSHYEEKKVQYESVLRRKANNLKESGTTFRKSATKKSNNVAKMQKIQDTSSRAVTVNSVVERKRRGYRICTFEVKPKGKKLKYDYVEITIATGAKRKIQVGFDDEAKVAYINKKVNTLEAIEKVTRLIK